MACGVYAHIIHYIHKHIQDSHEYHYNWHRKCEAQASCVTILLMIATVYLFNLIIVIGVMVCTAEFVLTRISEQ